jgi:dethiobiotin synthetase
LTSLAITGTDTGVGKTVVTASLVRCLAQTGHDIVPIKPFASGIDVGTRWQDNDPLLLEHASDRKFPSTGISPIRLRLPLSPYDAARLTRSSFDLQAITAHVSAKISEHDHAIIEGIGGVNVPLTADCLYRDFLADLEVPALIVSRTRLGTINHTLLTIESLQKADIDIAGIVYVSCKSTELELEEEAAVHTIQRISGVRTFGILPHQSALTDAASIEQWVAGLPVHEIAISRVMDYMIDELR